MTLIGRYGLCATCKNKRVHVSQVTGKVTITCTHPEKDKYPDAPVINCSKYHFESIPPDDKDKED